jgi:hypothetical protein
METVYFFYLNTLLLDFAATLLKELETMFEAEHQAPWQSAYIATPLDPHNPTADEVNRLKKRKAGRVSKTKGDYCLLAGDPQDAVGFYQTAEDLARANADFVWLAGALEGECAALILCNSRNGNLEDLQRDILDVIIEKYGDVLLHYSRSHAVLLELEASLKLARCHAVAKRKTMAVELLMHAHSLSADCSTQERILVCMAIARLCQKFGLMRKFSFFLREAAGLHYKLFSTSAAHSLFLMAAPYYQLQLAPPGADIPQFGEGWHFIQRNVLHSLISTSKALNDANSTVRYTLALLRTYYGLRTYVEEQNQISSDLSRLSKCVAGSAQFDLTSTLPHILKLELYRLPPALLPIKVHSEEPTLEKQDEDNPFIFTPLKFQKRGQTEENQQIVWIQHQLAQVKVYLCNPFAFPIVLESITLSTSGAAFQSYPVLSVTLPPHIDKQEIILTGKPTDTGTLVVRGCFVQTFGLVCEHVIPRLASSGDNRVVIAPALPLLTVRANQANVRSSIFEGQNATLDVELSNIGEQQVDYIHVKLNPSSAEHSHNFNWNEAQLDEQLPLLPTQTLHLSVNYLAKSAVKGTKLLFEYGRTGAAHKRVFELPIDINLSQGSLQLVHFNVLLPHEGIPFRLLPGDIGPPENFCLLSFEMQNNASLPFVTVCQVSDRNQEKQKGELSVQVVCEPKSVQKLVVPVRRFAAPSTHWRDLAQWCKDQLSQHLSLTWTSAWGHKGELSLAGITLTTQMLSRLVADMLSVTLSWQTPTQNEKVKEGAEEQAMGKGKEKEAEQGAEEGAAAENWLPGFFGNLRVVVHNRALPRFCGYLQIQPYQDMHNGTQRVSLVHKLAWVGSLQLHLPPLALGESYTHTLPICVLQTGIYYFQASCTNSTTGETYWAHTPLHVLVHDTPKPPGAPRSPAYYVLTPPKNKA